MKRKKKMESLAKAHLSGEELAARWQASQSTLANWRVEGKGPKFLKISKKILYPLVEVEKWEAQQLKKSTVG